MWTFTFPLFWGFKMCFLISEGSFDTEDWSNDTENSALPHKNKVNFKIYSDIKQLLVIIFQNNLMCTNKYCTTGPELYKTWKSVQLKVLWLFILFITFRTGWTFRSVTCLWRPWKSFLSLGFQSQKGITNPSQSHSCRFGPAAHKLAYTWLQTLLLWKKKRFWWVCIY